MVDGQYRFDVSRNMVNMSGPALSDFWLVQGPLPTNPKTGNFYSYYTAPASLVPLPLMILSRAFLGVRNAADRFSFSIASAFIGALIGPLLLVFFRRLRIPLKPAIGWTMVFALTTLWWPGSETVLDQTQHGIALLAMTLFAYDAAKGGKWQSALLTGLMAKAPVKTPVFSFARSVRSRSDFEATFFRYSSTAARCSGAVIVPTSGCSGERTIYVAPKSVSGRVVKTEI